MAFTDRLTAKTRARLEGQLGAEEQVLHSATVGAAAMVLTNRRLMIGPYVQSVSDDVNLPLSGVSNVTWRKGILGGQGEIAIVTSAQTYRYKAPNKQGEPAAEAIRKAIADL